MRSTRHPASTTRLVATTTFFLTLLYLTGCGGSNSGSTAGSFVISGTLASTTARLAVRDAGGAMRTVTKHISHAMAVNSQLATPDRVLTTVDATGAFSLTIGQNKPYFLVLVDSSQTGKDMIVAILKLSSGLQTLVARAEGSAGLGTVTVNADGSATVSSDYHAILSALGITESDDAFLRTIQSVALRYANPDIDGDGKIDITQGKTYTMDFHIRSNMFQADGTTRLKVADMTNAFFPSTSKVVFNLASAYIGYPRSLDATDYVSSAALAHGAAFSATDSAGGSVSAPTSYSSLFYGDTAGFGADYQLTTVGVELPGSNPGSVATYTYTLGALSPAVTLTFTNVGTRKKADLQSEGTIVPFVRLNTTSPTDKHITGVQWQFKKLSSGSWTDATSTEVESVVNDNGGYVNFYYQAKANPIGCRLTRAASGSLSLADCNLPGVLTASTVANVTTDDICNMAVSYDDKLGLRIFAGDALPDSGTTCN